jgi:predicted RNase H-like HicB family nuclease
MIKNNIKEYTAFLEKNENGTFTVTVPALPGLVTEITNLQKSQEIISDAINCYIDGLKMLKEEIPTENYFASMKFAVTV